MGASVIVLSGDNTRGGILKKILARNGFEVLWFKNYHDAGDALGTGNPLILIFDAKGIYSRETGLIGKLLHAVTEGNLIVLAKPEDIPSFEAQGCAGGLCLSEPLDPELVVSRVKDILSVTPAKAASEKDKGRDGLTSSLKRLLRLD